MTSGDDICRLDADSLARRVRQRELSPTEVVDAVLARMERLNPILNAVCTPTADVARAQARRIEAAIMADTVDEAAIRARSAEVAAVEADVAVSRAKLRNQVIQILTPEQRAEANRFQAEAPGRGGRHGPPPRF